MDRRIYSTSTSSGAFQEASTSTAGFWKLREKGVTLPDKPYLWKRYDRVHPFATTHSGSQTENAARGHDPVYSAFETGSYVNQVGGTYSTIGRDELLNIVRGRVNDKVRDQDIDLGVALGEYRETAEFVSSSMVKTARFLRHIRRGEVSAALQAVTGKKNPRHLRDVADVAAQTQLAISYGLLPLLNDVHGAVKALDKRNQPEVPVHRVSSSLRGEFDKLFLYKAPGTPVWTYTDHIKYSYVARASIYFMVDNPLYRKLDSLGLLNPMSIAWNLGTLTFVVDWFIPVGKYLTEIVPPQGVKFLRGWETYKFVGSARWNSYCVAPSQGYNWNTTMTEESVLKGRNILSSFPRYNLVIPDISLSKQKIASGMALIYKAFA